MLEDDFWYLLFGAVRDRGCGPIDDNMKICIVEGGQTKQMTMGEIENKFISENRDSFKSQASVPDQMIQDDLIDPFLNTSSVKDSLKRSYEEKVAETIKILGAENPKWKKEEVEKGAAVQAKKSIKRAMEEYGIPVYIFRGVNTYDNVGRFLESFGFKMSRLKAFSERGGNKRTGV